MNKRRDDRDRPIIGKWRLPELLSVTVVGLVILMAVVGFLGVTLGWWDMPEPMGVDPVHELPMGGKISP